MNVFQVRRGDTGGTQGGGGGRGIAGLREGRGAGLRVRGGHGWGLMGAQRLATPEVGRGEPPGRGKTTKKNKKQKIKQTKKTKKTNKNNE